MLNDKLIKIIEKILENPELTKIFLEFENLDDVYFFLREFDNNLTFEEVRDLLNKLVKVSDDDLDKISGGANFWLKNSSLALASVMLLLSGAVNTNGAEIIERKADIGIFQRVKDKINFGSSQNFLQKIVMPVTIAGVGSFTIGGIIVFVNQMKKSRNAKEFAENLSELLDPNKITKKDELIYVLSEIEKILIKEYSVSNSDANLNVYFRKAKADFDSLRTKIEEDEKFEENKKAHIEHLKNLSLGTLKSLNIEFNSKKIQKAFDEFIEKTVESLIKWDKYLEFTKREKQWIQLLAGYTLPGNSGFRYKSCEDFVKDTDDNLEGHHDFVQAMFPSKSKSQYANPDLYLDNNLKVWKKLLKENSVLYELIQKNMKNNFIRMLKFWKFKVKINENNDLVSLKADPDKQSFNNHNNQRVTRILGSLRLFNLNQEHRIFLDELEKSYKNHSSLKYWKSTEKITSLVV